MTFIYFLIFAQFAYLELVLENISNKKDLKIIMALMGLGGISGCVLASILFSDKEYLIYLLAGFLGCCFSGILAILSESLITFSLSATFIGISLGFLTVCLVSSLPLILKINRLGISCGLGTGIAYFISNVPIIFEADAPTQSMFAVICCLAGMLLIFILSYFPNNDSLNMADQEETLFRNPEIKFYKIVVQFLILIWLDSALFYFVQHNQEVKAVSWSGNTILWINAFIHLIAAIVAGKLLDNRKIKTCLVSSFIFFIIVVILVKIPNTLTPLAHIIYVVGISFYSTTLVAYLALPFIYSDNTNIAYRTAWLFAIAGWIGSALGIGMVQDLNEIPWLLIVFFIIVFPLSQSFKITALYESSSA